MAQGIGNLPPSAGRRNNPADYLFLLRPLILIPVWTFFLLGAYHGCSLRGIIPTRSQVLPGILSFTALLGAVYIINQITDREADRANRKLFLIPEGIISPAAAKLECGILIAVSLLSGYLLLPFEFLIILLLSLALGAAYSLEPIRLKRRSGGDVLANALGNGILNTLAGWVACGAPLAGWSVLLPYPLAVASVHLCTALADIEGDRLCGLRTSGVALGRQRGILFSTLLMGAAAAAAALAGNRIALYASLLSLPFFLIPVRSPSRPASPGTILLPAKISTLIFSLSAGILFPLYLPFLAAIILLTRIYYRRRWKMNYPSL
ncbi:MAG: UbiA family prenyltransferase [Candidatus Krumholzibacteriota bacterium]|nr:UbiA family prenyltransferase [Candidatus Krumholzibacteriota bacterium]